MHWWSATLTFPSPNIRHSSGHLSIPPSTIYDANRASGALVYQSARQQRIIQGHVLAGLDRPLHHIQHLVYMDWFDVHQGSDYQRDASVCVGCVSPICQPVRVLTLHAQVQAMRPIQSRMILVKEQFQQLIHIDRRYRCRCCARRTRVVVLPTPPTLPSQALKRGRERLSTQSLYDARDNEYDPVPARHPRHPVWYLVCCLSLDCLWLV